MRVSFSKKAQPVCQDASTPRLLLLQLQESPAPVCRWDINNPLNSYPPGEQPQSCPQAAALAAVVVGGHGPYGPSPSLSHPRGHGLWDMQMSSAVKGRVPAITCCSRHHGTKCHCAQRLLLCRLSGVWSLNEGKKRKNQNMLETFPGSTSAFRFHLSAHGAKMGSAASPRPRGPALALRRPG